MIQTRTDVSESLAAVSRATRSLARGAALEPLLAELAEAVAPGTGAEIAAIWLPDRSGALVARAVRATSAALAAELEGRRAESVHTTADFASARLEGEIGILSVPLDGDAAMGK